MNVAKRFTNFSDEDFSWKWNGVDYNFPAGETIMLQEYLVVHFAKHLIDRELHKANELLPEKKQKPTNIPTNREEMYKKCVDAHSNISAENKEKLEVEMLNIEKEVNNSEKSEKKRFCEKCDSKGVRHLKTCPTLVKEEFEGLDEIK